MNSVNSQRHAKLYRYQLPMDSGVVLRDNKLNERVGYIIQLECDGKTGLGEVAPLPGFSQEDAEQAGIQLQHELELWSHNKPQTPFDELYPSVAFGFSMAMMELRGDLNAQGNYQAAPLCTGDPDELIPVLNEMVGEKVAKVKVGLYEAIRDGMLVSLFLESIPDLTLRLDANRAWKPEKAKQFIKYISPSLRQRISFIEEPCQKPEDSLAFAIDHGVAIAWDETLQEAVRNPEFDLSDLTGVKAVVIKPTLIGSVERCVAIIERAQQLGIKPVLSSSIESSLGLTQIARLAQQYLPNEVPGLDTIGLYQQQLELPWPGCQLPVATLEQQQLIWSS
ncbi:o-succinylbenzoate synthase [Vibrio chagasii]|uniref:o-succinylbenzoate synthase n=1 Tax=Vibrio sp. 99K-1 TaxID=2607603 RepID=UPI0014936287|nr:o-succinylbenzoate synthase [Vibrio sp. 99K-1]CAH6891412.1 o-succinylbenzoate synthase [Vibrio chagasii]NOI87644.1 o-succinylbenzoate synthase [Vibrio sp. 99K-1]CAH7035615.1 o-succinylbenzoate synthase [Vibrio chagasii]CAH7143759.1 o-succinylbenzoate synthase [Vibrio chagasii]CAH7213165.1 o-succinylbenzoate synthase [Vibrio chagasii]